MNQDLNLCVIDDDEIYQYTVEVTVKSFGLIKNIMPFADGEEAINFIVEHIENKKLLPDVILLDINMPVMDGFQFMEEYIDLKIGKKITIYMVSSSVDQADIDRAKRISEISDYIVKPIQQERLKSIIEQSLNDYNLN